MKFSENLRQLRISRDITQKQLAEKLNIDKRQISKLETQYNEPNLDLLIKLADFFGCSTDYLLGREQEDGLIVIDNSSNTISDIEQHILDVFRNLTNRNKIKVVGYVDGIYAGQQQGA